MCCGTTSISLPAPGFFLKAALTRPAKGHKLRTIFEKYRNR